MAAGNIKEAAHLLITESPFPTILGRVCPAFCSLDCNRKEYDEAVQIRALERFLGDFAEQNALSIEKRPITGKGVGIVGAGPAGLSAAYFLTLLGHRVTIFERGKGGGVLSFGIPAYRLPKGVVTSVIERISGMGVEIREGIEIGKDTTIEKLHSDFDALFVAPGAMRSQSLGIENENAPEVVSGLEFLRAFQAGTLGTVSGKYAVIGGGNTALDAARVTKRLGGDPVIIYRRGPEEMPAFAEEVEEAKEEGIPIEFLLSPTKIRKKDNGKITLQLVKMELTEPDDSGRKKPVPIAGTEHDIDVAGVIGAIGETADLSFLSHTGTEELQAEGIYLGGDAAGEIRTVAHAAASGKRAAIEIDLRLIHDISPPPGTDCSRFWPYFHNVTPVPLEPTPFEAINTAFFEKRDPVPLDKTPAPKRSTDFSEVTGGLDGDGAVREAERCFSCGYCTECSTCELFCPDFSIKKIKAGVEIDYTYCKGCGICMRECPRGIIEMKSE
jgi:NADPH-dependent glutamate synthase beta subunit-like oxidoreductase